MSIENTSIRDVARLAKVSTSTVSNVLNERFDRMRPETTDRVIQAITQLGYTPNQLARQFKTGNVPIIGLIVPSVANPFWGAVARDVEEEAQTYGYQILLCNAERDPVREQRYMELLWSSGIRGVIFGSSPLSFDHLALFAKKGLQVVAFDRQTQSADQIVVDSVSINNVLGAQLAIRYLIKLGHRRMGLVSGPIRTVSRLDRLAGYRLALIEAGIEPDSDLIWEAASISAFGDIESAELGRIGARALLNHVDRPTALFTVNDMYAFGAYIGARDLGLRVPEDVSIVGFDDLLPLAEIVSPPLTTVHQPLREMMRSAVELLMSRLEKTRTGPVEHLTVTPELVLRASVAPPGGVRQEGVA
ncbi:MAG TPA: LacI family DNA-binding transcriptional regulator [Ktedonobacteraceae bacterium]